MLVVAYDNKVAALWHVERSSPHPAFTHVRNLLVDCDATCYHATISSPYYSELARKVSAVRLMDAHTLITADKTGDVYKYACIPYIHTCPTDHHHRFDLDAGTPGVMIAGRIAWLLDVVLTYHDIIASSV